MEVLILLGKTILFRPYVFIFLAAFLFSGTIAMGRRRTLVFLFGTWVLAFLSEYSSTRNGFPYGLYHYTDVTKGKELFLSNVPFMDSLSYSFLLFASYSMALFTLAPLRVKKWDIQVLDTFKLRQSWPVLLLTVLYMMMVDVVIDPVTLHGDRWFLGRIYYYEEHGHFFGVPLSNAFGWAVVAFVALLFYQKMEKYFLGPAFRDRGLRVWRFRGLFGVGLYYGVLAFILSVAAWIGEKGILIAGCFIFLLPTVILLLRLRDPRVRASEEEWKAYLKEFQLNLGE